MFCWGLISQFKYQLQSLLSSYSLVSSCLLSGSTLTTSILQPPCRNMKTRTHKSIVLNLSHWSQSPHQLQPFRPLDPSPTSSNKCSLSRGFGLDTQLFPNVPCHLQCACFEFLANACMARTCNLQSMIVSFVSLTHSLSAFLVFTFLHGTLSVSLLLTWRVLILGRDDKLPRNRGVDSVVSSGNGSSLWQQGDRLQWPDPDGRTSLENYNLVSHKWYPWTHYIPGAFPFVSSLLTFVSFLLLILPFNLLHCIFSHMHSSHVWFSLLKQNWLFLSHASHGRWWGWHPPSSCEGGTSTISISLLLSLTTTWQECWVYKFISPERRIVNLKSYFALHHWHTHVGCMHQWAILCLFLCLAWCHCTS